MSLSSGEAQGEALVLALAMTFATCWGVLQLAVLGSVSRSVRIATLLLAVGAGMYGCGVVAVLIEWVYTRALAAASGDLLFNVVHTAGYTVDPFIEEAVKILPLVVAGMHVRTRTQWGLTDYLLLGGAFGAGFGLLEGLMRFGHVADRVVRVPQGWLLPSILPPYFPRIGVSMTSWLPDPVRAQMVAFFEGPGTNLHLAWSVIAGFGVGVLLRVRGPLRLLGLLPVLLVGAAHAAYNYDVAGRPGNVLGDVLAAPFIAAHRLLWLWPLLALAAAVWLDVRVIRHGKAAERTLMLADEIGRGLASIAGIARYAFLRAPWTTLVTLRFIYLRRAALFASGYGATATDEPMLALVRETRTKMDIAATATAWRRSGEGPPDDVAAEEPGGTARWRERVRRYWPVLVWLVLLTPALLYYLIGSTPALAGAQDLLAFAWVFPLLVVTLVGGLVWITWQLAQAIRSLPGALRHAYGHIAARVEFQIATGAGAAGVGVLSLYAWLTGTGPEQQLVSNMHVLDALEDLLLIAGIALLLAAIVYFPPLAGVVIGESLVLVPTLTTSYVALTTLGIGGIMLSHAADNAGGDSGGGGSGGGGSGGRPRLTGREIVDNPQVVRGRPRAEVEQALDDLLSERGWTRMPVRKGEGTRWVQTRPNTGRSFIVERQPHIDDPLHQGWYLRVSDRGTVTRIPLEGNPALP